MSGFYVDAKKVVSVLLADGWHDVAEGSFFLGTCTFVRDSVVYRGEQEGFHFTTRDGVDVAGPLTSLLAVKKQ